MIRFKLKELIAEKEFQEKRRVMVKEISDATGINRVTISKLLNNKDYNTTLEKVEKLCGFFDCDICDMVELVRSPHPQNDLTEV